MTPDLRNLESVLREASNQTFSCSADDGK